MGKRTGLILGVGLAALSVAASVRAEEAPMMTDQNIVVVSSAGAAEVAEVDANTGAATSAPTHQKWAMGLLFGSLVSGFAALFGMNRLVQWMLAGGKAAGRAALAAAKAPVSAAKAAAGIAIDAIQKPGKTLLVASGLGIFFLTGIALLDLEWQIGLAIGAGTAIIGMTGVQKIATRLRTATNSHPQHAPA